MCQFRGHNLWDLDVWTFRVLSQSITYWEGRRHSHQSIEWQLYEGEQKRPSWSQTVCYHQKTTPSLGDMVVPITNITYVILCSIDERPLPMKVWWIVLLCCAYGCHVWHGSSSWMEPLCWSQFACTSPIGVEGRRKETCTILWSSSEPVTCQMLGMSTCSRSWRKVTSPRIPKWVCWLSSNLNACTVSMEMKKEEVARYSALSFQKYEESGSTLFFRIQFMCDLKEWNKVCLTCICLCVWSVSGCGVLYIHMHIGFSYVLQCAYTCIGRKLSRFKCPTN